MKKRSFEISNPKGMYDPRSRAFSHLGLVPPGNQLVFVAGQGGSGAKNTNFESQCIHSLDSINRIMETAGGSILDVVKFTVWMVGYTEDRHQVLIRELHHRFGELLTPTCSLIPVQRLGLLTSLIEIEAIGVVPT